MNKNVHIRGSVPEPHPKLGSLFALAMVRLRFPLANPGSAAARLNIRFVTLMNFAVTTCL